MIEAPKYVTAMLQEVGCEAQVSYTRGEPVTTWGVTFPQAKHQMKIAALAALGWQRGTGRMYKSSDYGIGMLQVSMYYTKGSNPELEAKYE